MKSFSLLILSIALSACHTVNFKLYYEAKGHTLGIIGEQIPGDTLEVQYLEAYCRAGSHDAGWVEHTVIPHTTKVAENTAGRVVLIDEVSDGVTAKHIITTDENGVNFDITITNDTGKASEIHWAQPCVRVGAFTGYGKDVTDDDYAYIKNSFIFLDGKPAFMPTPGWATEARYTPGQVWRPAAVPPSDVNPRPLNNRIPSNGLIGCVNREKGMVLGIAFEPWQELFQGVIRCLHSDFRVGGPGPGEIKHIRGKIYILKGDIDDLQRLYEKDFPEHLK